MSNVEAISKKCSVEWIFYADMMHNQDMSPDISLHVYAIIMTIMLQKNLGHTLFTLNGFYICDFVINIYNLYTCMYEI